MNQYIQAFDSINWQQWSAPVLSGLRTMLIIAIAWAAIGVLQRVVGAVFVSRPDSTGPTARRGPRRSDAWSAT